MTRYPSEGRKISQPQPHGVSVYRNGEMGTKGEHHGIWWRLFMLRLVLRWVPDPGYK